MSTSPIPTATAVSSEALRRRSERTIRLAGHPPDDAARAEVRMLLGDGPHPRELLIERLHRLNDHCGALFERHLLALAAEMGLAAAEVVEVAGFYPHFQILPDGAAVPTVTVRVCDGQSCAMAGAGLLLRRLTAVLGDGVRVVAAPCVGRCEQAPVAMVGQMPVPLATADAVHDAVLQGHWRHAMAEDQPGFAPALQVPGVITRRSADIAPAYVGYDAYRSAGGYRLAAAVVGGEHEAETVLWAMAHSGLRGLGGAGAPAGSKWRMVAGFDGPRALAVNIDEGEPGTFKDRSYLERDPHRVLEGALIAARVVGAETIYLYLRDEYAGCRAILVRELARLADNPPCALPRFELRRGAGAYICGEESALLESLEGKRGEPRLRPPDIAQRGLFGRPTLVQNMETLYWVRDIVERGPEWFLAFGRHGRKGLRSFSVSGRVRQPGVKLAPAGITLRELVDEYCGGMADGHDLYAYLPGGAAGGVLPSRLADVPLDFDTLQPLGGAIGSAAVVVLSQHDRARDAALNAMRFLARESCGRCTPCRVGTEQATQLMAAPVWDLATLDALCSALAEGSVCGLGQAAPNAVHTIRRHFPDEIGAAGLTP